ncbi:MAG: FkbM family methyltransferase [Clostridia bacterium]|nr:FkbM family methyltransferase [Clostridia bacterium]
MNFVLRENEDLWSHLKSSEKPVVMYGTGNGADKIISGFEQYGIRLADIFVSDEMYREGSKFHGHKLLRYADIKNRYDDCIIILAFAVFRRDLLTRIKNISAEYELLAPSVSVFGSDFFSADFLRKYEKEIDEAYSLLEDNTSRKVFINSLEYRLSGKPEYLFECQTEREEVFRNIISLTDSETFVDLGAYRGDTVEDFLIRTRGKYKKIYALEPDEKNFQKLLENMGTLDNAEFINKASWSDSRVLNFSGGGGRNSSLLDIDGKAFGDSGEIVHTTAVDDILDGDGATFIKMDVEGAEAETLSGMSRTLREFRPKLAVSAYHKIPDLVTLPLLIKQLNPSYRIFLRHHPYIPDWETNYYCV